MRQIIFRRTTLLMVLGASFLAGTGLGHHWVHSSWVWVGLSLVTFVATIRNKTLPLLIACLAVGLTTGWQRGASFRKRTLTYEQLYGKQVRVKVVAVTDGIYVKSGNLGFDGQQVSFLEPISTQLPGNLKVETIGVPAVSRGDMLEVTGKLYPAGGASQGSLKFAKASVLAHHVTPLDMLRRKFLAGMQTALSEPQASFALGLLIGQRSTLPQEITDQLSTVGLTHIVAVSGYNLTIIISFLGKKLGKSKFQTLTLSLTLITGFVLLTGFSASIVRAAIVSVLSLGAWYYGRTFRPLLILLLSGVITVAWNPIYIWSDIGWYLSFLAFFGVLVVGPLVTAFFWKKHEPRGLMPLIIESASAQIMAAPIIMHIFSEASLIALPSNILIVPLVPLAMLLSLFAGLGGMLTSGFSSWIAWPARILLTYMLEMISLLAHIPHAVLQHPLPMYYMISFYMFMALVCWFMWYKTKPKYGKITDITS